MDINCIGSLLSIMYTDYYIKATIVEKKVVFPNFPLSLLTFAVCRVGLGVHELIDSRPTPHRRLWLMVVVW